MTISRTIITLATAILTAKVKLTTTILTSKIKFAVKKYHRNTDKRLD